MEFLARREGSRIVIFGAASATARVIWTFESINDAKFWFEGRTSRDGGATWHLDQTISG